MWKSLTGPFKR